MTNRTKSAANIVAAMGMRTAILFERSRPIPPSIARDEAFYRRAGILWGMADTPLLARTFGPFESNWANGTLCVLAVIAAVVLFLKVWGWPPSDWRWRS
jgi:hypothetical protein